MNKWLYVEIIQEAMQTEKKIFSTSDNQVIFSSRFPFKNAALTGGNKRVVSSQIGLGWQGTFTD